MSPVNRLNIITTEYQVIKECKNTINNTTATVVKASRLSKVNNKLYVRFVTILKRYSHAHKNLLNKNIKNH